MSITGRGFRYAKKTAKGSSSDSHNLLRDRTDYFEHVLASDVIHTGLQLTLKAGTPVIVESVVPCANGVWFKTMHLSTPVWFLGSGHARSYETIYQQLEEQDQ